MARTIGEREVVVWGSGTPRREFVYSEDMADACIFLLELSEARLESLLEPRGEEMQPPIVNIGWGKDQSIRELAEQIGRAVGASATIVYDRTKPDGTPRKLLDVEKLRALGWQPRITLAEGLPLAYADFLASEARALQAG